MNQSQLERKLLAAAKAQPPSDAVPYGFEQRIMARLGKSPVLDVWADWSRALWRSAVACMAIVVIFGAWHAFTPTTTAATNDLSLDLERTVLASVEMEPVDTEIVQ